MRQYSRYLAPTLSIACHMALLLWLMYRPAVIAALPLPQAAIMVQVAPIPQAQKTEHNDIAREHEQSDAAQPSHQDEPEALPGTPVPEQEKAQIIQPPRKKTQPVRKPVKRTVSPPVRQDEKKASIEKHQMQLEAEKSSQTAAQQSTAGARATPEMQASWASQLMAHLEKFKRYPGRQTGTVILRFTLDDKGNVLNFSLVRSSGIDGLDRAALAMISRASPVPPPPPGGQKTVTVPVSFTLN